MAASVDIAIKCEHGDGLWKTIMGFLRHHTLSFLHTSYSAHVNKTFVPVTQMFPRHVLEHMMAAERDRSHAAASTDHLASSHQNVTLMFMDIVGEALGRTLSA